MQQNTQKDLTLIFTSIVVISLTVIGLMMFPDQAKVLADQLFTRATTTFGVLV